MLYRGQDRWAVHCDSQRMSLCAPACRFHGAGSLQVLCREQIGLESLRLKNVSNDSLGTDI